ncbi:MAG: RsmE family RNA methyltransferase [Spirochaetota bacterium]
MPQFFIDERRIVDRQFNVQGDDLHHLLRVRRVKPGDMLQFRDGRGSLYEAEVSSVGNGAIQCTILSRSEPVESTFNLRLVVAVLKGKKFDMVIQKAVETGVSEIIPVTTERTIPELGDNVQKKTERWQRIALEASKQSLRQSMPVVQDVEPYGELVKRGYDGCKIMAHADPKSNDLRAFLKETPPPSQVTIIIGPEGGFSGKEVEIARGFNWNVLHTGNSQFRSETAAIVIPAIILYEWGWR